MSARCAFLEKIFPKLCAAGYDKTSERTGIPPTPGAYNCIAWAASVSDKWWWPTRDDYWPWWSKRKAERKYFIKAFRGLGYIVCDDSSLEPGFEKVALYEMNEFIPEHMARQLPDGSWTSKCGAEEDITHFTLDALESFGPWNPQKIAEYGKDVVYMKRHVLVGRIVRFLQKKFYEKTS